MIKGVRFTKAMTPYVPGSLALLPISEADRMIREGYAVFHRFPDQPYAVDASATQAVEATTVAPRPAQTYKTKRA